MLWILQCVENKCALKSLKNADVKSPRKFKWRAICHGAYVQIMLNVRYSVAD